MTMRNCDLAIIGSGFGGSLLAMVARRLGLSVVLLERGKHPRFAIGESTTPLMNLLIEQLAQRYDLPRLLPLTTFGSWRRAYPEVVCGLKRGFSYFHHEAGKPFRAAPDHRNLLLVAASPHDSVADTHWLRADVDHFLLNEALATGADYSDLTHLTELERRGDGWRLRGEREGQTAEVAARLVIDASGPKGFLSRALGLPEVNFTDYPPTQALYAHFTGVRRCEDLDDFALSEPAPFPMDDAALHHVFEGGWMWVLRFGNGVTSAGFAVQEPLASALRLEEGEAAWRRFLKRFPSIGAHFAAAVPTCPFVHARRLPYRCSVAAGEGWALLPSAASFIDPLFSTGMPLTLLGIERMGRLLQEAWGTDALNDRLCEYEQTTLQEADAAAQLVGACYASFPRFPLFVACSMFYFAAASYSEMARRVERPHLVRRFLASDRPDFAPHLRQVAQSLRANAQTLDAEALMAQVREAIEPLNVAGLCDPTKRNLYGVDLEDVVRGSAKLEYAPDAMRHLLATAEWAQIPS